VPLQPFRKFPIWQRALVAFAGVGFNIIFAYLIMLGMLLFMGQQSMQTIVADFPSEPTIARHAGIHKGDQIVSIDGVEIVNDGTCISYLGDHKNQAVQITVLRDGKPVTLTMTTNGNGKVGMVLEPKGPITYKPVTGNFIQTAVMAGDQLCMTTRMMIDSLGQMAGAVFSGGKAKIAGQTMTVKDLHGVLAVIKMGSDIVKQDWSRIFDFTILISLDLAIINLLPWPALDGGHLAFMAFEAVRGRPMGERAQGEIVKWGFLSLIALMMVIMVNDITALVSGKLDLKKDTSTSTTTTNTATAPATGTTTGASSGVKPDSQGAASTGTGEGSSSSATPSTSTASPASK
jgi:membrane-associated protease RseP (regulator of RpoE activity)